MGLSVPEQLDGHKLAALGVFAAPASRLTMPIAARFRVEAKNSAKRAPEEAPMKRSGYNPATAAELRVMLVR
jgi:hypothetical protein